MRKRVIVIGAGVAGLATAIRLQHDGYDVEIFEKEGNVGGKMNQISGNGFKFDLGPTIVMMPDIYKEVFRYAGKNPDDYIPMKKLDPFLTVSYANGEKVNVSNDLVHLAKHLESISEKDAAGYLRYIADIYQRYLIAKDHFIEKSFRKASDFYNFTTLKNALKLKTFDTAFDSISKYVEDDRLKKLLSFQTLYIGISPYNGPSIYTIIPMIEMLYGVWFIEGGMFTMAKAMERLFLELGGSIHFNSNVSEILIEQQVAKGIHVNDSDIYADIVISNADFPYTMKSLVKDQKSKGKYTDKKIDQMDYSCSCYLMYLGLNKKLPELNVHNIFFANDFDQNIKDIFEGTLPMDPSIYLYVPSKVDETVAPKDKESLYVLVPVPQLSHGKIDWNEKTLNEYRSVIVDLINKHTNTQNIEEYIEFEEIVDPIYFAQHFNAYNGATFGLAPTLLQSNYFRPQPVSRNCKNLYFTGSSVHPGAGVPIVLTSGKLTAEEVRRDHY